MTGAPHTEQSAQPEDVRTAYNASVAVVTNLGTVRFAIAALFVAAQIVLFAALGQASPSAILLKVQRFIPFMGLAVNVAMVIFEIRNNVLASTAHETARKLEALLRVGSAPTPFIENKKLDSIWTHWLALQVVYGVFLVAWAVLVAIFFFG